MERVKSMDATVSINQACTAVSKCILFKGGRPTSEVVHCPSHTHPGTCTIQTERQRKRERQREKDRKRQRGVLLNSIETKTVTWSI